MIRKVQLKDISDGQLYGSNDLVKADCGDCKGCHACCCGTAESIILDPLDITRLSEGLGQTFQQLLASTLELGMVDGMILPNLRMEGSDQHCIFLNEEGRCRIHTLRPGICRMFPLARYYENGKFAYILQIHECPNHNRTKIKVGRWLDTPNLKAYEKFAADWHNFLQAMARCGEGSPEDAKAVNLYVLQQFYMQPYTTEEFYADFERRLQRAKENFGI